MNFIIHMLCDDSTICRSAKSFRKNTG